MLKVKFIFNSDILGGAEISLIEQIKAMSREVDPEIWVPLLKNKKLQPELKKRSLSYKEFCIPSSYFNLSRTQNFYYLRMLVAILGLLLHFVQKKNFWKEELSKGDILYLNGNKVAVFVLGWLFGLGLERPIAIHFRDYVESRFLKKLLKALLKRYGSWYELIANSEDVARKLERDFGKVRVVYNLTGETLKKEKSIPKKVKTLGLASMFAPWKGLHWSVFSLALEENRLKSLGYEKVILFGDQIYQTKGEHENYGQQIQKLTEKVGHSFFHFAGRVSKEQVFEQIDVLIHPSLEPEPFGRIILEAQKTQTYVISTGLGGSSELLGQGEYGFIVSAHDHLGLFKILENLASQGDSGASRLIKALEFAEKLNDLVYSQLGELVNEWKLKIFQHPR